MAQSQHSRGKFTKVFDHRKRRVRRLWRRNGAFYAQLTVTDPQTGERAVRRVRIDDKEDNPVQTLAKAIEGMAKLKAKREEDELKLTHKRTPSFAEYAASCLQMAHKRPRTMRRERVSIKALNKALGKLRLREITSLAIKRYVTKRQKEGSVRSVNLQAAAQFHPVSHWAVHLLDCRRRPFGASS